VIFVGTGIDDEKDGLARHTPDRRQNLLAHLCDSRVHNYYKSISHLHCDVRARAGDHVHVPLHVQQFDFRITDLLILLTTVLNLSVSVILVLLRRDTTCRPDKHSHGERERHPQSARMSPHVIH
jgi:hypothetical protein